MRRHRRRTTRPPTEPPAQTPLVGGAGWEFSSPAEAVQWLLDFFLDDGGHVLAGGDGVNGAIGWGFARCSDRDWATSWSMVFSAQKIGHIRGDAGGVFLADHRLSVPCEY